MLQIFSFKNNTLGSSYKIILRKSLDEMTKLSSFEDVSKVALHN